MAAGLFGGMTDYRHLSMTDILNELESEQNSTILFKDGIERNLQILIDNSYWVQDVPIRFQNIVSYSIKYFETTISEFDEIREDLLVEVKEHHFKRLKNISLLAGEINVTIGKIWHQEYLNKEYDKDSFRMVENIYIDTRDLAVRLLDTANIAERLQAYIGKQSKPIEKKRRKLETGHKITLASVFLAFLVLLFGTDIVGRYCSSDSIPDVKISELNVTSVDKIIVTLILPYLEAVPILDKGLFIKYYYNDFILGGANIESVKINARTKTGEHLNINGSDNEITFDINTEPYIEFEYKNKYYSIEITGNHYNFNCIIKELKKPTLELFKH